MQAREHFKYVWLLTSLFGCGGGFFALASSCCFALYAEAKRNTACCFRAFILNVRPFIVIPGSTKGNWNSLFIKCENIISMQKWIKLNLGVCDFDHNRKQWFKQGIYVKHLFSTFSFFHFFKFCRKKRKVKFTYRHMWSIGLLHAEN